jgi:hypothetical protein
LHRARIDMAVDFNLLWGFLLTLAVVGALGVWFFWCGRADKRRQVRPFARSTLLYAGAGFVVGVAFLTSDLGPAPPEQRLGLVAFTLCCFLLLYAAISAMIASNDQSLVLVNLTGRALLLTAPELAPFYTLPAPQEEPARELPPIRPRTYHVVSAELGRLGAKAGRTALLLVDPSTSTDLGKAGPLRVRRLLRANPADSAAGQLRSGMSL